MALNSSQFESKMICYCRLFLFLSLSTFVVESQKLNGNSYKLLSSSKFSKFHHVDKGHLDSNDTIEGKKWAVLIAGSLGYENYRHQVT